MRILFSVLLALICCRGAAQVNLCDTIMVLHYEPIPVSVSPTKYITGYEIPINDVKYKVTLDKKHRVQFVATTDSGFATKNITIGTKYFQIPKHIIVSEGAVYGWGYQVALSNGWHAVFNDPVVLKSLKAERDSKIGWFYKDNPCYDNPYVAY
jgi:hypothetical protein